MSHMFFNKEVSKDYSYLLLSAYNNSRDNCGSYYKGEEGEYITSILTGEKFYSVRDFVLSVKGYGIFDEITDCFFYDEEISNWVPIFYI